MEFGQEQACPTKACLRKGKVVLNCAHCAAKIDEEMVAAAGEFWANAAAAWHSGVAKSTEKPTEEQLKGPKTLPKMIEKLTEEQPKGPQTWPKTRGSVEKFTREQLKGPQTWPKMRGSVEKFTREQLKGPKIWPKMMGSSIEKLTREQPETHLDILDHFLLRHELARQGWVWDPAECRRKAAKDFFKKRAAAAWEGWAWQKAGLVFKKGAKKAAWVFKKVSKPAAKKRPRKALC